MSSHRLSLAQERPPPLPSPSCSRLMWSWRLHKLWCWLLPESSPNRWEPLLIQVCYSALLYSFCLFLWGKCSRLFQKESGKHFSFISMPPVTVSVGCVCQWHKILYLLGAEKIKAIFIPVSSAQWEKTVSWYGHRYLSNLLRCFASFCSDSWAQVVFQIQLKLNGFDLLAIAKMSLSSDSEGGAGSWRLHGGILPCLHWWHQCP